MFISGQMSQNMSELVRIQVRLNVGDDVRIFVTWNLPEQMSQCLSEQISHEIRQSRFQNACPNRCWKICQKICKNHVRRYSKIILRLYVRRYVSCQSICQKTCQVQCPNRYTRTNGIRVNLFVKLFRLRWGSFCLDPWGFLPTAQAWFQGHLQTSYVWIVELMKQRQWAPNAKGNLLSK